jgi:hypothetical protein
MRKILFAVIAVIVVVNFANAQFEKGNSYLGPSIGLYFHGSTPIFGANYEYAMKTNVGDGILGIGGIMRYWSWSEDIGSDWGWDYTDFMIGGQANYHFRVSDGKFDPWAGLTLAYDIGSVKYKGPSGYHWSEPTWGGLFLGVDGGARYWFSNNVAGTVRINLGSLSYSAIDFGVDFKL